MYIYLLLGNSTQFPDRLTWPLLGKLSWLEHCPDTPKLRVQSLAKAHTRINQ